jgi:aldehyde dehydrogenase (NAD+)
VIDGAVERGDGRMVAGGSMGADPLAPGTFVEPTVFADVDPASPLGQDEVFGPVLSIIGFDDEQEAVDIANGTRFGLAGYVWTRDLGRAHRVADALVAGYVSINSMAALPPGAPFGGWKESGHGVEGGRNGLMEYLRVKNVHVQW